jgi:cytochrome P450
MLELLLFSVAFCSLGFYLWKQQRKPPNFPPGPAKWPVIGSLAFSPLSSQKENHRVKVAKMVEEYGPTVGLYLGSTPIIYLHDPVLTRKLFSMEVFSGRFTTSGQRKFMSPNGKDEVYGILRSDGKTWHGQRRFSLKTLKDLGFGRISSEVIIQEEASLLIDFLAEKSVDGDFLFQSTMNIPIINVLWRMVASKRFQMDDAKAEEIMLTLTQTFASQSPFRRLILMMPGLRKLLPKSKDSIRFQWLIKNLFSMFRESIKEHKGTLDPSAPRDFIDYYIMEIEKTKDDDFSEDQLIGIIFDLFLAGAETTSTTMKWAVLLLTLHPEVQVKCRKEMEEKVGSRQPGLADMDKLVYCQATILEIQRLGCTVPSSLNHRVLEDTTVDGLFFPKNSIVLANIYYMSKSEAFWEDPHLFNPSRFLKDGKVLKDLPQMMPFSVGRRVCMGDSLARNELSIFFTSMVQRLKFSAPVQGKAPSPDNFRTGITSIPDDYLVNIQQC